MGGGIRGKGVKGMGGEWVGDGGREIFGAEVIP